MGKFQIEISPIMLRLNIGNILEKQNRYRQMLTDMIEDQYEMDRQIEIMYRIIDDKNAIMSLKNGRGSNQDVKNF